MNAFDTHTGDDDTKPELQDAATAASQGEDTVAPTGTPEGQASQAGAEVKPAAIDPDKRANDMAAMFVNKPRIPQSYRGTKEKSGLVDRILRGIGIRG